MAKQNTVFKDAYNRTLKLIEETDTLPSEPELGGLLSVSRTTVRAVLTRLGEVGLVAWDKRSKTVLRRPVENDYFPDEETNSLSEIIERSFMRRILAGGAQPGMQINELELAREIGIGTTSVREFLIRFSRFGLIEKRPNSHWVLKGFTREFALELTEVREMFELRSAAAFVHLAADHPAWAELKTVEAQHHALLAEIDTRYTEFSELDEAVPPARPEGLEQPLHHRFLRHHRDRLPLPLPVEQDECAGAQPASAGRASRLHQRALFPRSGGDPEGLPAAPEIGARNIAAIHPGACLSHDDAHPAIRHEPISPGACRSLRQRSHGGG